MVKPPLSNGSRGVRVIAQDFDRKKTFYEEKPSSLYTTIDELHAVLGDEFPELIVMEYLPGEEYTVDVCRLGNEIIALPRKRLAIRSGITFAASLEKNDFLISALVFNINCMRMDVRCYLSQTREYKVRWSCRHLPVQILYIIQLNIYWEKRFLQW